MQDEFSLIRSWLSRRPSPNRHIEVDVGDDAAVVQSLTGNSTVLACDTMVETVHFKRETLPLKEIGRKLLAVNASDINAMGATPVYALICVSAPDHWQEAELMQIYEGLYQYAEEIQVTLIGGDTTYTPGPLTLSLTLAGEVEKGHALRRSAAKPGDLLFVTGTLGDSAAGLDLLMKTEPTTEWEKILVKAHHRPDPPLPIGSWLSSSPYYARISLNDISDGLAQEAWEIAEASGVSIVIEEDKIPLSPALLQYAEKTGRNPFEWAWSGGEDFQLLGTIPPAGWKAFMWEARRRNWRIECIGKVESGGPSVEKIVDDKRLEVSKTGYNHFANR
ncbi:thiamine-phosphate kinase [Thermoactinomyces mirandus]|uniref:Thiamine-monophosphate kinase n=1 Tax=Thermoactinomyces mirandus TaxID=2756294 RepID=A0A7W1XUM6_9BACL|nr:thiamine-phosphate kinase [Thermoactinomyces mirandus]MBA4603566.1 thiamine-phosphate kinase [Thermoactinomyces mirandus]